MFCIPSHASICISCSVHLPIYLCNQGFFSPCLLAMFFQTKTSFQSNFFQVIQVEGSTQRFLHLLLTKLRSCHYICQSTTLSQSALAKLPKNVHALDVPYHQQSNVSYHRKNPSYHFSCIFPIVVLDKFLEWLPCCLLYLTWNKTSCLMPFIPSLVFYCESCCLFFHFRTRLVSYPRYSKMQGDHLTSVACMTNIIHFLCSSYIL